MWGAAGSEARRLIEKRRIHLGTSPGSPLPNLKRKLGVTNVGLYCNSCGEFFAFGVDVPDTYDIQFTADAPLLVRCPFCEAEEPRSVDAIERLVLTEGRKRRLGTH